MGLCRHLASSEMTRSRVDCATEVLYSPPYGSSVFRKGSPVVEVRSADRAMVALVPDTGALLVDRLAWTEQRHSPGYGKSNAGDVQVRRAVLDQPWSREGSQHG